MKLSPNMILSFGDIYQKILKNGRQVSTSRSRGGSRLWTISYDSSEPQRFLDQFSKTEQKAIKLTAALGAAARVVLANPLK